MASKTCIQGWFKFLFLVDAIFKKIVTCHIKIDPVKISIFATLIKNSVCKLISGQKALR